MIGKLEKSRRCVWICVVAGLGFIYLNTVRQLYSLEPRREQARSENRRFKTFLADKRRQEMIRLFEGHGRALRVSLRHEAAPQAEKGHALLRDVFELGPVSHRSRREFSGLVKVPFRLCEQRAGREDASRPKGRWVLGYVGQE